MGIPTEVNFINESDKRIKIDLGDDDFNLYPGESKRHSSPPYGWFMGYRSSLYADIIINPEGPDNNKKLGSFRFEDYGDLAFARSDDFFTYTSGASKDRSCPTRIARTYFHVWQKPRFNNNPLLLKTTWGLKPLDYVEEVTSEAACVKNVLFQGFAPSPVFDMEAFPADGHAMKWDLHIKSVPSL